MVFDIASELPGRLRLRCGRNLFDDEEARGVAYELMGLDGVRTAEVHASAGSILVTFEPERRDAVLAAVRALDPLDLPRAEVGLGTREGALEISLENNRFQVEVSKLLLWRVAKRVLLPMPLRAAIASARAVGYVLEGLRHLLRGEVSVEVLDACAIATSCMRGQFAEAGTISFLLQLSGLMEEHVQSRAHLALRDGMVVRSESVWAVVDGQDVLVRTEDIRRGMVLHLGAGQVLPVDGTVVEGAGEIDQSSMTGESALVRKGAGSTVYAGTALEHGDLKVSVTAPPGTARIDNIVSMVEESSELKASAQSRAERLADGLVPYSFLAFFGIWALTRNINKAMAVLMVDYSCAIKLSTPIAVMSAMDEATRHGVTVRGGKYLEALAAADTVVFDKTGTLTNATPAVSRIISCSDATEDDLLRLSACIEEHFPHSMARAIVGEARSRGLAHERELHAEVRYVVAHGIATRVDGDNVCIGSAHFLFEDEGVEKPEGLDDLLAGEAGASSTIFVAKNQVLLGCICISDPPRSEAKQVLRDLRALGFSNLVMITGDSEGCAKHVSEELGLDGYFAQVLPEDKASHVQRLKDEGHTVVMVGDGINDSPALAAADVSVAMSDASDIARAVADVLVHDSSLESLVTMRLLAQRLMGRIHGDYRFIVGFNTALIACGVASVMPITTAAYLHNVSTLGIAALNTTPLLAGPHLEAADEPHGCGRAALPAPAAA
ncbi:heavy metal translocating P-type ATPase [Paratractidigestivibacter sp.]|uniref:heavy metal translocating P-type ATPase n=1 Tax=Paratractidigestivibacter sp. TaxID=2847316 RepID=UPI002AC95AED|nr:heavy metal translocating P-type ATPase [Paratractidigestivibacter sp.]